MGAWGAGPFQNDDAGTLVDAVLAAEDLTPCWEALGTIWATIDSSFLSRLVGWWDEIEADEASEAIAAAEVIAAILGRPSSQISAELQGWVQTHQERLSLDDIRLARRIVKRIRHNSELSKLWVGRDGVIWREFLKNLEKRLTI